MTNIKLSVCMIVKNEHDVLKRCLTCAEQIADEIIIVDTGSSDDTIKIASDFTKKVYKFKWVNDFSKARNYSFKKATCQYVMWLDADDVIEPEDIKKINQLKQNNFSDADVIMCKYNLIDITTQEISLFYYRERIVKNNKKFKFKEAVHEAITPSGKIIYSDAAITHKKLKSNPRGRNLLIYEQRENAKQKFSPRAKFYYARELYFNQNYDKSILWFKKFLKCKNAWIENVIEAHINLAKCFLAKKKYETALKYLFLCFNFTAPRADLLCNIGEICMCQQLYQNAIFWYESAIRVVRQEQSGAFINPDFEKFIPYIEMCVCYYNLGQFDKAISYNDLAAKIKPTHPSVMSNKIFFNKMKKEIDI